MDGWLPMANTRKSAASLVTKLLVVQLPLVGLVIVGFFAFLEFDAPARYRAEMVRDTARALAALAPALTQAVRDSDDAGAQRLMTEFGELSQVQSAMLTSPDGAVLARVGDPALPVSELDLQVERQLSDQGEAIGFLDVALTTKPIQTQLRQRIVVDGLLLILVLGVLTLATIVSSQLAIHRPLAALRRSLDAARRGRDLQPASWQGGDELNEMVRAFNEVQQAQSAAEQELSVRQDQLESSVEQRKTELKDQRILMKAVLDSTTIGVVAFDNGRRLSAWNRSFLDIRGYPESLAVVGTPFEDFVRHDAAHREFGEGDPEAQWQEDIASARLFVPPGFERRRPNGRFIQVGGGSIEGGGFLIAYTDIGDRKRSEQSLLMAAEKNRRQTEGFRSLAASLSAMVFQFTTPAAAVWRLSHVSPSMREAFAFGEATHGEASGQFMDRVHPDDRAGVAAAFDQAIRARGPFHQAFRIRKPSGEMLWLEAAAAPSESTDGDIAWDGLILDMTQRRKAEGAWREKEGMLHTILDSSPIGVGIVSPDGRFSTVNPSLAMMLRRSAEEMSQLHPVDLFDSEWDSKVARRLAAGEDIRDEPVMLRRADGSTFPAMLSVAPASGSDACFVWIDDISDRRRAEEELLRARAAAEAAGRARSALLAAIGHEVRTPMNGVIGMLDLLRETELTPDQRRMALTARDSGLALLHAVNDRLAASEIEAGELKFERVPTSLRDVMEGVSRMLLPAAEDKGLRLSLFIDPAIPSRVLADPLRLRQILSKLLGNAVRFTEPGPDRRNSVGLRAERLPDAPDGRGWVCFTISDSGIGMPAEAMAGLFRPVGDAGEMAPRRFGGAEPRLTVCGDLASLMGGRIDVASEVDKGSTFTVTLPFDTLAEAAEEEPDLAGVRAIYAVRQEDFSEAIERYMAARGAQARRAMSLRDLEKRAASSDVVILSEAWAGGRYDRLVARLREQVPGIRFVAITRDPLAQTGLVQPDTVVVHSRPFLRSTLLHSVALAVGRANAPGPEAAPVAIAAPPAPTADEARRLGQLILVAEDNRTNQDVIRRQLAVLGRACDVVGDGRAALERLRQGPYAMLLTDCDMPRMDGLELTAAVRAEEQGTGRHLPIIAITANVVEGAAERCVAAGMDGFLPKPLEMARLREVLDRWMPAASAVPLAVPKAEPVTVPHMVPAGSPPVDVSALTSVFGDERTAVVEILTDFVGLSRGIVADIHASLEAQDAVVVTRAAHKLKSSARAVGAAALADIAFELERAGKAEDWPALSSNGRALMPAFDEVAAFVTRFADSGPVAPEAIDRRVLHDTFGGDERTIREIMADFIGPARASAAEIGQAYAARSAGAMVTAAQQLKLSARALGAQQLADACQALEQAGRAGEWEAIDASMASLGAAFEAVISHIRSCEED